MYEYSSIQPFKVGDKVKFDWDLNDNLKSHFKFNGGDLDKIYTVSAVHMDYRGVPHISLNEPISPYYFPSYHFVLMTKPVGFLITDDED